MNSFHTTDHPDIKPHNRRFYVALVLAIVLQFCIPSVYAEEPDLSKTEDIIQVVAAILKRHPNFVSRNNQYRRNLFELYREAGQMLQMLGSDASPTAFGPADFIWGEYSTVPIRYDETLVEDVRNSLIRDLDDLGLTELGGTEADVATLKQLNMRDGHLDPKRLKKKLAAYVRLLPFLYDGELKPMYPNLGDGEKKSLRSRLGLLDAASLDNYYNDQFLLHQAEKVTEASKGKGLGDLQVVAGNLKNQFIDKTLRRAIKPLARDEKVQKSVRRISLERVTPLAAVVRGTFGNDCSMSTVPFYPLVKGTWVYWIRKSNNIEEEPTGYALVTTVKMNGKEIPYIVTINGPINEEDVRAVKHLVARDYKSDQILTHDFEKGNPNVVNSDQMRRGLKPRIGKSIRVEMPAGWDQVDRRSSAYYKGHTLQYATLEKIADSGLHFSNLTSNRIETPYPKPKDLSEMSRFERALIAAQAATQQTGEEELEENRRVLMINEAEFNLGKDLLSRTPQHPIDATLYRSLRDTFHLSPELIQSVDYLTAGNSLAKIHSEDATLIPRDAALKIAGDTLKTINIEFAGFLREAPNLNRNQLKAGFFALVEGAKLLKPFSNVKNDELRLRFIEMLLSDAVGDKVLERLEGQSVVQAAKDLAPPDPGFLTERAIESLSSAHPLPRQLAATLLAEQHVLSPEDQHAVLKKLSDPDAEKAIKDLVRTWPQIQLSDSGVLTVLVDDPDVSEFTMRELLPKYQGVLPVEQANQIYRFLLANRLAGEILPPELLEKLGPISPEIQNEILEKLNAGEFLNHKLEFINAAPDIFTKLNEKARKDFLDSVSRSIENSTPFIHTRYREIAKHLTHGELKAMMETSLSVLGNRMNTYATHFSKEEDREQKKFEKVKEAVDFVKELSNLNAARLTIPELYDNLKFHPEILISLFGPPYDWDEWKRRYDAIEPEENNSQAATHRRTQMWKLAFRMQPSVPAEIEAQFWKWIRAKVEPSRGRWQVLREWIQAQSERGGRWQFFWKWVHAVEIDLSRGGWHHARADFSDVFYSDFGAEIQQRYSFLFAPINTLSESFYTNLFDEVPRGNIPLSDAISFYAYHPRLTHYDRFLALVPAYLQSKDATIFETVFNRANLTPKQKEQLLIKIAESKEGPRSIDILQKHARDAWSPELRQALLNLHDQVTGGSRERLAQIFSDQNLDIEVEINRLQDYSTLELAQKWYEDGLSEKSSWLSLARKKALTETALIQALREDKKGFPALIEKSHSWQPIFRVFDGLVVEDSAVREKILNRGYANYDNDGIYDLDLIRQTNRFLTTHIGTLNAEVLKYKEQSEYGRALENVLWRLRLTLRKEPKFFNRGDDDSDSAAKREAVSEMVTLARALGNTETGKVLVRGLLENDKFTSDLWMGIFGQPYDWKEWAKRYDAIKPKNADHQTARSRQGAMWKMALYMQPQMPSEVETGLWKWMQNQIVGSRHLFQSMIGRQTDGFHPLDEPTRKMFPDLFPRFSVPSDSFYARLFEEVSQGNILTEDALRFFREVPRLTYYDRYLDLIPAFVGLNKRSEGELEKMWNEGELDAGQKRQLLMKVVEGATVKNGDNPSTLLFLQEHAGEVWNPEVESALLSLHGNLQRSSRETLTKIFTDRKINLESELLRQEYSLLELAERWYQDDFSEASQWMSLASKKGFSADQLIQALRADKGRLSALAQQPQSGEAVLRLFDGEQVQDPLVRSEILHHGRANKSKSEESVARFHRFLLANIGFLDTRESESEYARVFTDLVLHVWYDLQRAPFDFSRDDNSAKVKQKAIAASVEIVRAFAATDAGKSIVPRFFESGQFRTDVLMHLFGQPYSWQEWIKHYDAIKSPETENRTANLQQTQMWKMAFYMRPAMPPEIEEKFWSWWQSENGSYKWKRFREVLIDLDSDTYSIRRERKKESPDFFTPWVAPSDNFYNRVFDEVSQGGLQPKDAIKFYQIAPQSKHLDRLLAVVPDFAKAFGGPGELEKFWKEAALPIEQRGKILANIARDLALSKEGSYRRDKATFLKEHASEAWTDDLHRDLLKIYHSTSFGNDDRAIAKGILHSRGLSHLENPENCGSQIAKLARQEDRPDDQP